MAPINATDFMNRLNSGEQLNLLDVREELEYLTYNIGTLGYNKTDELIVICTMGKRSETARLLLNETGYVNARNLSGGLIAIQRDQQ